MGLSGLRGRFGRRTESRRVHADTFGSIPDGAHILHSCDNPPCVNPGHLRPGTRFDNMQDKVLRGRHFQSNQTPLQAWSSAR
ncbi:HNH endonuclease [Sinomonas terricola]|uniref:HNH endonuclease n=1 Tax=Sinomonas terricola TaxID=3110330 RepID=UPI003D16D77F